MGQAGSLLDVKKEMESGMDDVVVLTAQGVRTQNSVIRVTAAPLH